MIQTNPLLDSRFESGLGPDRAEPELRDPDPATVSFNSKPPVVVKIPKIFFYRRLFRSDMKINDRVCVILTFSKFNFKSSPRIWFSGAPVSLNKLGIPSLFSDTGRCDNYLQKSETITDPLTDIYRN